MSTASYQQELEETVIVDTDIHLRVPPTVLAEYVDEPHRGYLKGPFGSTNDIIWDVTMGEKIQHKQFETAEDVERDVMGDLHVDVPIVNTFGKLSYLPQTDRAVELMRGYNRYLLDRVLDENDAIYGLAEIAPQRPDLAAEMIDDLASEDQIVGVFVLTTGAYPPLGDTCYDVMYRAAEDNGLPFAFHASAGSAFKHEFPRQHQGFETWFEVHSMAHVWSQMMTLTSLIRNGVPVKFPDLKFVMLESGLGWVPYMMYRLNKEYSMRRSEAPLLERSPESYVRDSFYFSSQPLGEPEDPRHMRYVIEMVGVDSLLFASDYPHYDFDHPSALYAHLRSHFDEAERRQVMTENPLALYDITL
jgi:hypothetical protein